MSSHFDLAVDQKLEEGVIQNCIGKHLHLLFYWRKKYSVWSLPRNHKFPLATYLKWLCSSAMLHKEKGTEHQLGRGNEVCSQTSLLLLLCSRKPSHLAQPGSHKCRKGQGRSRGLAVWNTGQRRTVTVSSSSSLSCCFSAQALGCAHLKFQCCCSITESSNIFFSLLETQNAFYLCISYRRLRNSKSCVWYHTTNCPVSRSVVCSGTIFLFLGLFFLTKEK